MKHRKKLIAVATAGIAMSPLANADIVNGTMTLSELLSAPSGSYSGNFSISSLLASNNLSGGQVIGAQITAFGFSDMAIGSSSSAYNEVVTNFYSYSVYLGGGYTYSYSCGWFKTCYSYVPASYGYAVHRDINGVTTNTSFDTTVDQMRLLAGNGSAMGADSRSVTTVVGGYYANGTRGNGTYGYDSLYQRNDTVYDSFSGALQASYSFGATELLALAQSGQLDFTVQAANGQFNLNQVAVTLEVTPVPEPSTYALMAAGLALLSAAARKRRKTEASSSNDENQREG